MESVRFLTASPTDVRFFSASTGTRVWDFASARGVDRVDSSLELQTGDDARELPLQLARSTVKVEETKLSTDILLLSTAPLPTTVDGVVVGTRRVRLWASTLQPLFLFVPLVVIMAGWTSPQLLRRALYRSKLVLDALARAEYE